MAGVPTAWVPVPNWLMAGVKTAPPSTRSSACWLTWEGDLHDAGAHELDGVPGERSGLPRGPAPPCPAGRRRWPRPARRR